MAPALSWFKSVAYGGRASSKTASRVPPVNVVALAPKREFIHRLSERFTPNEHDWGVP